MPERRLPDAKRAAKTRTSLSRRTELRTRRTRRELIAIQRSRQKESKKNEDNN